MIVLSNTLKENIISDIKVTNDLEMLQYYLSFYLDLVNVQINAYNDNQLNILENQSVEQ